MTKDNITIQWLQTFTFLHVDKFTFAWFQCQWNIFKGDYHVLFAKYYMKLKPQNVLVLSSNRIFTTFHKKYLHSLQSSIIHCSIIVILNHIHFHLHKAILHKHKIKWKLVSTTYYLHYYVGFTIFTLIIDCFWLKVHWVFVFSPLFWWMFWWGWLYPAEVFIVIRVTSIRARVVEVALAHGPGFPKKINFHQHLHFNKWKNSRYLKIQKL